jgi:hypothetical protein
MDLADHNFDDAMPQGTVILPLSLTEVVGQYTTGINPFPDAQVPGVTQLSPVDESVGAAVAPLPSTAWAGLMLLACVAIAATITAPASGCFGARSLSGFHRPRFFVGGAPLPRF